MGTTLGSAPGPAGASFPGQNGKIAFASGDGIMLYADASGRTPLTQDAGANFPEWSPDGSRIAFHTDRDGNFEIYVMNADGSGLTNLTNSPSFDDMFPTWSPDGSHMAFERLERMPRGSSGVYVMNADGTDVRQLHTTFVGGWLDWSPDGAKIALAIGGGSRYDVYVMNADGSGQTRLTNGPGLNSFPDWSPDGSKIAFTSDRDGNPEIYVMNADGSAQTRLTNNLATDEAPAWSPDGSRIAFSGNYGLSTMNPDGSERVLVTDTADFAPPDWQPVPVVPTPTPTRTSTPTPTRTSTPAPLPGDVSCDQSVDSVDAALILQLDAGLIPSLPCLQNADVDRNGLVNAIDAALVLQFNAGLLHTLPA